VKCVIFLHIVDKEHLGLEFSTMSRKFFNRVIVSDLLANI